MPSGRWKLLGLTVPKFKYSMQLSVKIFSLDDEVANVFVELGHDDRALSFR